MTSNMTEEEVKRIIALRKQVQLDIAKLDELAERVLHIYVARRFDEFRSAHYELSFEYTESEVLAKSWPSSRSQSDGDDPDEVSFDISYLWLASAELETAIAAELAKEEIARQERKRLAEIEEEKRRNQAAAALERRDRQLYEQLRARFELTVLSESLDDK